MAEKKQITILRSLIRPERKSTPRHIALEMRIVAIAHQMMSLLRRRLGRNGLYALVILIYNEQFEETKAVPGYIDKCKHGDWGTGLYLAFLFIFLEALIISFELYSQLWKKKMLFIISKKSTLLIFICNDVSSYNTRGSTNIKFSTRYTNGIGEPVYIILLFHTKQIWDHSLSLHEQSLSVLFSSNFCQNFSVRSLRRIVSFLFSLLKFVYLICFKM